MTNRLKIKGQIAIFALLMGLLGLTIATSAASRSLSDLRQVTIVDSGTKALAAAEAGVEYALSQLATQPKPATGTCTATTAANLTLTGIKPYTGTPATSGVVYEVCSHTPDFAVMPNVAQDDVFQVNFSDITAANVKAVSVLWKNPNASLEIIKVDGNDKLTRYVYNGVSVTANNGFAPAQPATNCLTSLCADATFSGGSCTGPAEIPYNSGDKILRLKPVYANTDLAICAYTAGNSPGRFALQYYYVTARATTTNNVVKKILTSQIASSLPSIFDNVFFSGGDISK